MYANAQKFRYAREWKGSPTGVSLQTKLAVAERVTEDVTSNLGHSILRAGAQIW